MQCGINKTDNLLDYSIHKSEVSSMTQNIKTKICLLEEVSDEERKKKTFFSVRALIIYDSFYSN